MNICYVLFLVDLSDYIRGAAEEGLEGGMAGRRSGGLLDYS